MGRDKAHLPWRDTTLIEQIVNTLGGLMSEVIVVVKDARAFEHVEARVVEDLVPNAHALGGVYTGLMLATHERCFVCACDTPFLNAQLVDRLLDLADGYDLVIPRTPQGLQPLHAVYAKSTLPVIARQLQARRWDIRHVAEHVRTRVVDFEIVQAIDPEGRSFVNLNTPHDYGVASASLEAELKRR